MKSLKQTARLAGFLYLLVALFGLFAQFIVRGRLHIPGDAVETSANIVNHSTLFRLGVVADLFTATCFVLLGMTLYVLFRHVSREVSAALVVFVAIGAGITLLNLLNQFAALLVATDDSYAAAWGRSGSDALTLLLMDMQSYGYTIAGIAFGLWLLPLGLLANSSGLFPRTLGVVLIIACFSYVLHTLLVFLVPGLNEVVATIIATPAAIAEFWTIGYLLLVGVRNRPDLGWTPVAA